MFTIQQIQSLNELEMEVYQCVVQHQNAVPYMRIRELAMEAHVSTTTILRFCRKIGCDGYAEFKLKMKELAGQQQEVVIPEDLSELSAFITRMETPAFQKKLDTAAASIAGTDRVLCIGVSNSGYIAQYAARYFVFSGLSGFLSIPNAVYNASAAANCEALGYAGNYSSSIIGVLLGTVTACIVAFVLVQIVGFDDPVEVAEDLEAPKAQPEKVVLSETSAVSANKGFGVYAPMNGEVKALEDVPDETFAGGVLGKGVAIIPEDGRLYAPFDCTIASVFDTKHALCLAGPDESELLIHVGLETVTLGGKYFRTAVKDGDTVKKGELLMEFDLDAIAKQFKTITPILITNADDYDAINPVKLSGKVKAGELLYTVN